jgi:beta-galactosidase/beta-glucuronidase
MKINKLKIRKSLKTRRSFLKSAGILLAGAGMFNPSVLFRRNGTTGLDFPPETLTGAAGTAVDAVQLPKGVKAVWDINKAFREATATRERICINGLWLWQPAELTSDNLPKSEWGYFKVPGSWHNSIGSGDENQNLYSHPAWREDLKQNVVAALFQRELNIPDTWKDRRIILSLKYVNSNALIYIDGTKAGEVWFPDGEIDVTSLCKPGNRHVLTIKVRAVPLKDVITAYSDTNMGRQVQATVVRRGICGDVFISSVPAGPHIDHLAVDTSFRREEITFKTGLLNLQPKKKYRLSFIVTFRDEKVAEFTSSQFDEGDLEDNRIVHTEKWMPAKLWDTHTPENIHSARVSLIDTTGKHIDEYLPVRFGYREFWIDGRDFYLNGSRIWLSCIPLDNAQSGVAMSGYEMAKESLKRLKDTGINFVYTHNYDSEPGSHLSFDEILQAADDTGMLIALSQPHFSAYDWDSPDSDTKNGYVHHASFYTQVARNHPSVVFYSTSHNATGYVGDMNPVQIGGRTRLGPPNRNVPKALRAEAIIRKLDPGRIVYHHSSGNLSSMYTCNFYGNWIPAQEMNEWFGPWAKSGETPAILVEYSTPFTWDYGMYRGWYKGKREFGAAMVPWEFCLAEWNAQFIGDEAYSVSDYEKANLRWEAAKFAKGEVWGRSDYPYSFDSAVLDERNKVLSEHFASNWRAFRTWGVSGVNAMWHYTQYWRLPKDFKRTAKVYNVDWDNLQKPGFSPDIISKPRERFDMAYSMSDWEPTIASSAISDNQGPLLAYIGGKPEAFTDKAHNFVPGESFEKQLIIVNNSRETIKCECRWTLNLPQAVTGNKAITVATGQKEFIPVRFDLPASLEVGKYHLRADFLIDGIKSFSDNFEIDVLPQTNRELIRATIALFDPKGETARMLDSFGITYKPVETGTDLAVFEILIIGKGALTLNGKSPNLEAVRNGLKVIIFEQDSEVLEKRLGFRVQEYGLRKVFRRIADHPALKNVGEGNLRDWRGEATILSPVLEGAPEYKWCGIPVQRVWRCGTRGNVASVLIEKPACGNFLPITDGGFSLQYSPLMEYREDKGMVVFCQMDITGRTEQDPAAKTIALNLISYAAAWKPSANRQALYTGSQAGKEYMAKAAIKAGDYIGGKISPEQVLIAGPESSQVLSKNAKFIKKWLKAGGQMLAVGLDQPAISTLFPEIRMKKAEHIATFFTPFGELSPFAGIAPADVYNRAPKEIPLVESGAFIVGNGILGKEEASGVTLCQIVPWQQDYSREQHNIKQTFRRSAFLLNRLLGNLGIASSTDFLSRFHRAPEEGKEEKRWLNGLYLDVPEEWDDPYRFFRW